jgi:hypothetical protein
MIPETIEDSKMIETLATLMCEYQNERVTSTRWPHLVLTESARCRFFSIIGWLHGAAAGGTPTRAIEMAQQFFRTLDGLCIHQKVTRTTSNGYEVEVPGVIVEMTDDGCRHSFSFCLYRYVDPHEQVLINRRLLDEGKPPIEFRSFLSACNEKLYAFMMNGGLIFHGDYDDWLADRGEWSTHT